MSGISLNVTLNPSGKDKSGKSNGNEKHERFLKKKQYLMRKGLLKDKQNRRKNRRRSKKQNHTQINGEEQSKAGAIFPKFNTTVPHTSTSFISTQTFCQKSSTSVSSTACTSQGKPTKKMVPPTSGPLKYVAMDCEMVGTGPKGSIGELGRCSIVSYNGDVIYDKFVKPTKPVTDFRTRWSGIRRQDLHYATPFQQAQKEIIKIMTGKVVVGHAIHNDFKALKYFHPACQTRDTTKIPLLNQKAGFPEHEPASLKRLTKALFNKDIQTGKRGHSSVEDAKATMELYKVVEVEWERKLASEAIS